MSVVGVGGLFTGFQWICNLTRRPPTWYRHDGFPQASPQIFLHQSSSILFLQSIRPSAKSSSTRRALFISAISVSLAWSQYHLQDWLTSTVIALLHIEPAYIGRPQHLSKPRDIWLIVLVSLISIYAYGRRNTGHIVIGLVVPPIL